MIKIHTTEIPNIYDQIILNIGLTDDNLLDVPLKIALEKEFATMNIRVCWDNDSILCNGFLIFDTETDYHYFLMKYD